MTAVLLNPVLFQLPTEEIKNYGLQNLTYGSLSKRGTVTMVGSIARFIDADTIKGLDLGCGDGELIYHLQAGLSGSVWEGVEISDHRVQMQKRDVTIWQGDMLKENLRPYNVLHADNLCLEDHVAEALEKKIALEFSGLYISYRKALEVGFLRRARLLDTMPTETTWTTHPIHYYWVN
jgi:hypothetical protein